MISYISKKVLHPENNKVKKAINIQLHSKYPWAGSYMTTNYGTIWLMNVVARHIYWNPRIMEFIIPNSITKWVWSLNYWLYNRWLMNRFVSSHIRKNSMTREYHSVNSNNLIGYINIRLDSWPPSIVGLFFQKSVTRLGKGGGLGWGLATTT